MPNVNGGGGGGGPTPVGGAAAMIGCGIGRALVALDLACVWAVAATPALVAVVLVC